MAGVTDPRTRHDVGSNLLTRSEWLSALAAPHGNVRRYLSGCRCWRCDTSANARFAANLPRRP